MASTLHKLRVGVVSVATLLVVVVAGFVWYGHHVAKVFVGGLANKYGIGIKQTADGVTFSHSDKGRTVFTVHAAKQVQHTNGVITLHDVGIVLYGRQDGKEDRIHGNEFEVDQAKGVMRAVGEVYLDLAAPDAKNGAAGGDSRTVHVKTSGLVFNQKTRSAATDEGVEFAVQGITGSAVGAEYDSVAGVMVLRSAVHLSGLRDGKPMALTAGRAEARREQSVVMLESVRFTSVADRLAADHATVHLDKQARPERVEAQGHVELGGEARGTLAGERLEVALNPKGQPRTGHLWGGVRYAEEDAGRKARGEAQDLRVGFDEGGHPVHAVAGGGVVLYEKAVSGERTLRARAVDVSMDTRGRGRVGIREAAADGAADLRMVSTGPKGVSGTEATAERMVAKFVAAGAGERVASVSGRGKTMLSRRGPDGAEETSRGDEFEVSFKASGKDGSEIDHARQRGGFTSVRTSPGKLVAGKASAPAVEHAKADEATYDAPGDRLTLSGSVEIADAASELRADRIALDRRSGDATAEGGVRVSYIATEGKGEPMHVTAARMVERRAAGTTDFFGAPGADARMWQAMSQVEAPALHLEGGTGDAAKRRLVAGGEVRGGADVVKSTLVSGGVGKKGPSTPRVARVLSHGMIYTGATHRVEFTGQVRLTDAQGVLRADEATVFLAAPVSGKSDASTGLMGGRVERVVARGAVEIEQTGRRATGQELVYTAADETFVLTGSKAAPPRMVDEARGTITGGSLRFRSGDDSVFISGGEVPAAVGQQGRVHTETRVRQQ